MFSTVSFSRGGSHVSNANVLLRNSTKQPSCLYFSDKVLSNKYITLPVNENSGPLNHLYDKPLKK